MAEQTTNSRDIGSVTLDKFESVAVLTLSRPSARNSLTWEMYQQLENHLTHLKDDLSTRVLVIRGDGDQAFAAGTDISQFDGFTGKDGLEYEKRIDKIITRLVEFPKPTIAAVQGFAVGGGMLITTGCDLRYATPNAQFGAPMARTLGNCLSLTNYQRLIAELGPMRTKELLYTSRLISADEALSAGFLTAVFDDTVFMDSVMDIAHKVSKNAPLTIHATKEALIRLNHFNQNSIPHDAFDDVVEKVYGSKDFAEGVSAYMEKRKPNWSGK